MYHNEEWGTVCSNSFSVVDGNVACRELGYSGVITVYKTPPFPVGSADGELHTVGHRMIEY